MPQDVSQDLTAIKEWLAKEPHLPQDLDDFMLKKFLHSCYGSLEKTKKCIDKFSTTRAVMSEIYTSRDPLLPKLKTAFSITTVATLPADKDELLFHQLNDPALEKFSFYDILKAFSIQADFWLKLHDMFPEGHIVILDIKDYTLKIIPKEAMPVRVKQVHVINCPSYYDKLYALVKPALPSEICDIITFHSTQESLHKAINKKYLPIEYGGESPSIKQQHIEWIQKIEENRSLILNDNLWKADLKKKPKGSVVENSMSGSFRTLSID